MRLQTDNFIEDLERWRDAYIRWMKVQDYSGNTIELYRRTINQFIEFSLGYQDEMTLRDTRTSYFNDFVMYLEEEAKNRGRRPNRDGKYLSKSTKDAYMKAIRGFFNFISDNNDDLYDFSKYLKNIKIRDRARREEKIKYLSEDEVARLIDTIERIKRKKENYPAYRNALLVKLMLFAGLRISEALTVRMGDFTTDKNRSTYEILIYGKGGKLQNAYISKSVIEDEMYYFKNIAKLRDDDIIMRTRNNTRLDRFSASRIVKRIYEKAGIHKSGLHILRHTLAMMLVNEDKSPIVIQSILRHSNISTTTVYAKAEKRSVESALTDIEIAH